MTDDLRNGEYSVGYRKPPEHSRWKKGQTGNPRGSTRAARARAGKKSTFGDLLPKGLRQTVETREDGRNVRISALQLGIRRRIEAAAKGDLRSLKEVLNLRDVKEAGPLAPGKELVLTLDELRAAGPLGFGLYQPHVTVIRESKPSDGNAPVAAGKTKRRRRDAEEMPYQSVAEIIEFEFERKTWVTDPATGLRKRMTMRELIAEQLIRLFAANRPGSSELLIRLNQRSAVDRVHKIYVEVPWDYVMPPKLGPDWLERGLEERRKAQEEGRPIAEGAR